MSTGEKYIASMPTVPFAFRETRIVAELMLDGLDRKESRARVHEGNLFQVKTDSNEAKSFNYIFNRLDGYPDELKQYILSDDLADARTANVISIMGYDALFREFVFDIYSGCRERCNPVTDYAIMGFFERKAAESDTVRDWTYVTVFKLRRLYARILYEAGYLRSSSGEREISTPLISSGLAEALRRHDYGEHLHALMGGM